MCGVLGIVTSVGREVSVSDGAAMAMRDRMTHRGPDDAGMVRLGVGGGGGGGAGRGGAGGGAWHVLLAHRRLSVLDPTSAGHQPMGTADGRLWLVYNGEIYNDAALREDLIGEDLLRKDGAREGVAFKTRCDTETLLVAIERWGVEGAVNAARGMFAFGVYDARRETLTLARDAMGIKPLYWARTSVAGGGFEFVFASEIPAILGHPAVSAAPDMLGVGAYMTTIRTTTDDRTMYEGVRVVRPGEMVEVDLRDGSLTVSRWWLEQGGRGRAPGAIREGGWSARDAREVVTESVRAHLRSDVQMCALLSGGLDSTIVCRVAMDELGELRTYCSGSRAEGGAAAGASEDFGFASRAAAAIGSRHVEAPVTREMFGARWRSMVGRMGVPLSTPNEVAINEVARRLREDGNVVTLSGEGADELFGGYAGPMSMAKFHVERGNREPGLFQLGSAAWMSADVKAGLLREEVWRGMERDAWLCDVYRASFERVASLAGGEDEESVDDRELGAHLRFQREINLVGLLQRLDSATMLESVEGRTPFADVVVAAFADRLPMRDKFVERVDEVGGSPHSRTKIALREAFGGVLPREIVERPKASFPLPFQAWVSDQGELIRGSAFLRACFRGEAVEGVASDPSQFWAYAWPMANLAMWAESGL